VQTQGPDSGTGRSGPREFWALEERIVSSRSFGRSERLKDLLVYLSERTLSHPGTEVREHEIRSAVFGRHTEDSTRDDTIVRVQVSKLRKKLDDYFASEGTDEPTVIEIPRGQYAVVWRARDEAPIGSSTAAPRRARTAVVLGFVAAFAAGLCVGVVAGRASGDRPPVEPTPALDSLWTQMFRKDQQTHLVLADSTLSQVQDALSRSMTLEEYLRWDSLRQAPSLTQSLEADAILHYVMARRNTSLSVAAIAREISLLDRGRASRVALVFPRDFHARHFGTDNVILLGSPRSNPWFELFKPAMSLRFHWDASRGRELIRDHAPKPGPPTEYVHGEPQSEATSLRPGYCVVAFLPNLARQRNVLLIGGTDAESTGAGGHLLTDETALTQIRERLQLQPGAALPHFEALLSTRNIGGTAPSYEVVVVRRVGS
jgi:hypothetical protein